MTLLGRYSMISILLFWVEAPKEKEFMHSARGDAATGDGDRLWMQELQPQPPHSSALRVLPIYFRAMKEPKYTPTRNFWH